MKFSSILVLRVTKQQMLVPPWHSFSHPFVMPIKRVIQKAFSNCHKTSILQAFLIRGFERKALVFVDYSPVAQENSRRK